METSVFFNGNHHHSFSSSASQRHVSYSCGACGYELNLSSSNRNISIIGSKYGKSMKRGIISFLDIDESRFTQVDELQCIPHFSKNSWSFFRHRTKLLCRKCGNHIGIAYDDKTSAYHSPVSDGSDSVSVNNVSGLRKYDVRIRALQPSSAEESGTPLFS
ncbi:Peptide methionine sulfoxide reductase MrsB [Melia azedarach]|uniref:Peptide methionine sulfoxide reductase MrsB n=1 Tax=Melia azedarach TaxID=155640 RepID=A0ACC1WP17_MELAZ|nr:Peptide methionine sulfoxide reductase MrsB [Melia azedarach]